ncbi:MAG: two-component system response regulator KdpE [Magnetococcales bacterium]|nr:two-component system response regulator KdpE [Magnetococcales bacterium]
MNHESPTQKIVFIEDEPQIRRFVRSALESEGLDVMETETGKRGLIEIATRRPDLVIIDLGLPDLDGIEVIRDIRSWSHLPILILSARTQETEKVKALDAGADDYLTKPFGMPELLARVRALLRRSLRAANSETPLVQLGEVTIDRTERRVARNGEPIHLTVIEYRLLSILLANPGRVLTHRILLKEVWGPGHTENIHYLRVYMSHLRQKLEQDPNRPRHLLTESGVGYRLVLS